MSKNKNFALKIIPPSIHFSVTTKKTIQGQKKNKNKERPVYDCTVGRRSKGFFPNPNGEVS